jgi:hypothetical protein
VEAYPDKQILSVPVKLSEQEVMDITLMCFIFCGVFYA